MNLNHSFASVHDLNNMNLEGILNGVQGILNDLKQSRSNIIQRHLWLAAGALPSGCTKGYSAGYIIIYRSVQTTEEAHAI